MKSILLILFLTNFSYINAQEKEYFSGIIEYKITYDNIDERLSTSDLESWYGNHMTYYIDNKGYYSNYSFENETVQHRWFNGLNNTLSFNMSSSDTLYYYNAKNTDYIAEIQKGKEPVTVYGYECYQFKVSLTPKLHTSNAFPMKYDFYITSEIIIDKSIYKDFEEGAYNEILEMIPGIILKQTYYGPYYRQTRTAIDLTEKEINYSDHLPKKKFVKKEL